eukprot:Clim_evm13s7 gene=Clim_evmTU13s7
MRLLRRHSPGVTRSLKQPASDSNQEREQEAPMLDRGSPEEDPSRQGRASSATRRDENNEANVPKVSAPSRLPDLLQNMAEEHPLKILVVDDNPLNRRLTGMYLQQLGYNYDMAEDGAKGIEMMKNSMYEQDYDVVLMDLHMPVMNGHEATATIRQMYPKSLQPSIIALTASDDVEDTLRCLSLGFQHYIAKPISAMDLATVLVKCQAIVKISRELPVVSNDTPENGEARRRARKHSL